MTLTIVDDDLSTVTIGASDPSAAEAGPDAGKLTITRSGGTSAALVVHYTVGGSATPGADYGALAGTVTIASGQSSATIAVTPVDDSNIEGNETVVVTLSANPAYTVGASASATVTISDNDAAGGPGPRLYLPLLRR